MSRQIGNKKIIKKFMKELDKKGLCEQSKKKYRYTLEKFLKINKINFDRITKSHIDKFFFSLKNNENLSDETKEDYWIRFRVFLGWIKPKYDLRNYKFYTRKKRKLPDDILNINEIRKIISCAETIRNRAMMSVLYDSGCRPSELVGLRKNDVVFDENGMIINFNGKTGERRIRVITTTDSDKILNDYFTKDFGINERIFGITIERLNHIVKKISKMAGIKKRVYPYLFRHSRATHLAQHLTEQQMKIYFGWIMGSRMVQTYVHLSCRDLDETVFELNNKEPFIFIQSDAFKEFLYRMYQKWREKKKRTHKIIY